MSITVFSSFSSLPDAYRALLTEDRYRSLFLRPEWFENFAEHGLPNHSRMRLLAADNDRTNAPMAVLVGFEPRSVGVVARRRELHCVHPDHVEFCPYLSDRIGDLRPTFEQVARYARQSPDVYDEVKFAPLDPASGLFEEIRRAFVAEGFLVRKYFLFANWYDEVMVENARDYLDRRPSVQQDASKRRSRRRKSRRSERQSAAQFQLVTGGMNLEPGIADYVRVTAGSWQGTERLPGPYIANALSCAAELGSLRLGLMYSDGRPATAQFWTTSDGVATCYRTSYDQRYARHSLGSVLTKHMIEHVIDVDKVSVIDFGQGDEAYKNRWVGKRRELWGLVAFNPRTLGGLVGAVRDTFGRVGKHLNFGGEPKSNRK